jgi:thioredoxin reductase
MYDVIIVGGGPAGLSAALVLGRCCRKVLVCDSGSPRNGASRALHAFLTRDGTPPLELLRLGREELAPYSVDFQETMVEQIEPLAPPDVPAIAPGYRVVTEQGAFEARKVLLATGVKDVVPEVPGAREFYGRGVFHCPYCDAWEYRDQALVAFASGEKAIELALSLRQWSATVTLCTHGAEASAETRERTRKNGIQLEEGRVATLEGESDRLGRLKLEDGRSLPCDAFFFSTGQYQRSPLADILGCECDEANQVCTNDWLRTNLSGCYCAGDAGGSDGVDVQFAIRAASEGATAAVGINKELLDEEIRHREASSE